MITIDLITLLFIVFMLLCIIIIPLGDDVRDSVQYRKLERKYKKLRQSYLELIDVFEKTETGES